RRLLPAVPGARDRHGPRATGRRRGASGRRRGGGAMTRVTIDGNEAAVSAAYRLNDVCCIYPITPSSAMAELADEWSSKGRPNIWGGVPTVVEMQSEGGAAG